MLFNSLEYFLLLITAVVGYWISPNQNIRKAILFGASIIFYITWSAPFILLLFGVCLLNWLCSKYEEKYNRSAVYLFAVFSTLAVLAYFKYSQFLLNNLALLAQSLQIPYTAPKLHIILPLGISFYCFQIIAYTMDAKERKFKVDRNPLDVLLFIIYFPQLIAGPICHRNELMPQLNKKSPFSWQYISAGLALFAIGLFLKVTFADGIAPFVDKVFAHPENFTSGHTLQAVLGYTVQILGDFWGYSTMAVGSSLMFGIRIPTNFNLPYASKSLQEFWRRWHITLSLWLRDYLYIRVGGSRATSLLTYRNLMITMVLGGLWHGANWTFIVWGTIHGTVLSIERFINARIAPASNSQNTQWLISLFQWSYTFAVVVLAWVFFRATHINNALHILSQLGSSFRHILSFDKSDPSFLLILLFIPLHLFLNNQINSALSLKQKNMHLIGLSLLLLFLSIIFSADDVQKFIYFEF